MLFGPGDAAWGQGQRCHEQHRQRAAQPASSDFLSDRWALGSDWHDSWALNSLVREQPFEIQSTLDSAKRHCRECELAAEESQANGA
jgi:hypothetical protein